MLIDISWPLLPGMVMYKNRHPLDIKQIRTIAEHGVADSGCNYLYMHTGTHVDAPSHFLQDGPSIEQLSLEQMNGLCRVLDLTHVVKDCILMEDLLPFQITSGERILLKTRNSYAPAMGVYGTNEVYMEASAARFLANIGIALVGIDALGLERNQPGYVSHRSLFAAGVIIVEGLRLAEVPVERTEYTLHLLPLAFVGTEAAPARAVLSF